MKRKMSRLLNQSVVNWGWTSSESEGAVFRQGLANDVSGNSKNAIIVLETSKKSCVEIPSFYSIFDNRIYGKTKIYFLIKNN